MKIIDSSNFRGEKFDLAFEDMDEKIYILKGAMIVYYKLEPKQPFLRNSNSLTLTINYDESETLNRPGILEEVEDEEEEDEI